MKKIACVIIALGLTAIIFLLRSGHPDKRALPVATNSLSAIATATSPHSDSQAHLQFSTLKTRLADFTDFEKGEFASNFTARYKPAFGKWCDAFSNHVPISADELTTNNFVERIGTRPTYREYIFVVNGITLGIHDKQGVASVDYLNAPEQTRKLATLPDGSAAPISSSPVSKDEMVKILLNEGGSQFTPNEVRITPSGYSGSLNGGAYVRVGGDPDNAASWKYDIVFGADGKLAYYLKGN